jgi:hypothetical protein
MSEHLTLDFGKGFGNATGSVRGPRRFRQTPAPIDYRFPPKWGLPTERTASVRG